MNMVVLSVLWMCWCAMHSILINVSFLSAVKRNAPGLTRYYRLLYNGFSLFTFVPLLLVTTMVEGPVMVNWEGYGLPVRSFFLITAFLLFKGGAQKYDLRYFLGIKQLQTGEEHLLLSDTGEFLETGVFGITRHPWYLGSLLFIWSVFDKYTLPVFLGVCIMSLYLVIGTVLEERKIIDLYGDRYRQYQQRVSMLFPWKWLKGLVGHGNQSHS